MARWACVLRRVLLVAAVCGLGLWQAAASGAPRAQAPANFAYMVYLPGWNVVSFGDLTGLDSADLHAVIRGPLYTFQPGDDAFEARDLATLTPGEAYWVYFTQNAFIFLRQSAHDSVTTLVPAGRCALLGNPSTRGSARIAGAAHFYTFSTALNRYDDQALIGVGRGGWACADQRLICLLYTSPSPRDS